MEIRIERALVDRNDMEEIAKEAIAAQDMIDSSMIFRGLRMNATPGESQWKVPYRNTAMNMNHVKIFQSS